MFAAALPLTIKEAEGNVLKEEFNPDLPVKVHVPPGTLVLKLIC
jgi:hypothetical protein